MRSGDPAIAKSSKTWTQQHKPFGSPVQRTVPMNQAPAPQYIAPASQAGLIKEGSLAPELRQYSGRGVSQDFNIGGQPRGSIMSPKYKP